MATERFKAMYPKSSQIGLAPAANGDGVEHPGFDIEEVEKALGKERFEAFIAKVAQVFSCGHRVDDRGVEIHCAYAQDLENFLQGEK